MKRLLSLFLAMLMVMSLVPAAIFTSSAADIALYWPLPVDKVAIGRISSKFGPRTAPTSGASTNHRGIDLPAPSGTPVYSVFDGVVTAVGKTNARGNYVVIHHPLINMSSLYQHLTVSNVQVGDSVVGGTQVAVSGNTGVGTGAHLHYGLMIGKATNPNHDQPGYNMAIDPMSSNILYVAASGGMAVTQSNNPDDFTVPTRNIYYTSPVMTGNDVKWIQAVLFQLGYTIGIDGSFGPATQSVVKQFQADYGLDVDGSVGPATRSKLQELWNYKKTGNITAELHSWVSTTEYGESPAEYFLKDTYYLNFEIIDAGTGAKINSLVKKSYTVVMAFFNPDGSVHSTVTLASTDTGTLAAVPVQMGTYLAAVAVVGDLTLNTEFYFTARYNPTMTASVSSVSLNLAETSSRTFDLTLSGSYPDMRGIWCSLDTSVATATVGNWNGTTIPVTVTGVGVGSTTLTLSLIEGHTGGNSTVGVLEIPVNVTTNTYTVSYNANGGTDAPAAQTKHHNTNLTLSTTVPTRSGYKFLGWSTSASATTATYAAGDSYTLNSNATLYAVWEENVVLSSISVYAKPSKTTYYVGDALNSSGLVIRLAYSNGVTENITSGFSLSGFSSATAGTKTVTVSYSGKTASFSVNVKAPSLSLSESSMTVLVGKVPVTATTDPAGQNVTWKSDNTAVVAVENGVPTAKKAGSATLTATFYYNGIAYEKSCIVTVECTHVNTSVHSAVPPTTSAEGYTGDTYCDDCGELLKKGEAIPMLPVTEYGDINGDGKVDIVDYSMLRRYLAGGSVEICDSADLNGDGEVDITDCSTFGRYLSGANVILGPDAE